MPLLRLRAGLLVAATFVLVVLATLFGRDARAYAPPPLHGAVVDTANALTPAEKGALESRIATYRVRTTNEIVVLLLPSLGGETIEVVAYAAFNTWKIGKKGKDNGVLVAIAFAEHKLRIETGKGVGDRLTDIESSRINRERIAPFLKQGRTAEGIGAGLDAIEAALDGKPAPPLPDAGAAEAGATEASERPLSRTFWFALDGVGLDAATLEAANASAEMDWRGWGGVVFVLAPTLASFDFAQFDADEIRSARNLHMDGVIVIAGVHDRKIYLEARQWSHARLERTYGAMASALAQAPAVDRAALEAVVELAVEADRHAFDDAPKPPPEPTEFADVFPFVFGLGFVSVVVILVVYAWRGRRSSSSSSSSDSGSSDGDSDFDSSSSDSSSSSSPDTSSSSSSSSDSSYTGGGSSDSSYTGGGGSSGGGGSTDSW